MQTRDLTKPVKPDVGRYLVGGEDQTAARVTRDGGRNGAGVIRGLSLSTRGEALGHNEWVDADAIADVVRYVNEGKVKSRLSHPSMSNDGTGKLLGRFENGRVIGDKAVADLHFSRSSHNSPNGNLATYVMDLVDGDEDLVGLSIEFRHDYEAEQEFTEINLDDDGEFESPDADNVANLPHVRFSRVVASDVVDRPAANPDGLFHRIREPVEAFAALDFASGRSDTKPEFLRHVADERIRELYQRWESSHASTTSPNPKEDQGMTTEAPTAPAEDPQPQSGAETKPNEVAPETSSTQPADTEPSNTAPSGETDERNEVRSELMGEMAAFQKRFGENRGVKFWQSGIGYAAAMERYCDELLGECKTLTAENAKLKGTISSAQLGEGDAIEPEKPKQKIVRRQGA